METVKESQTVEKQARETVFSFGIALTVLLGLQLIRTLVPFAMFLLKERLEWSTVNAGILVFVVFAASFLAAPLGKFSGYRRLLLGSAALVGLLRLGMQLWTFDPLGDFIMAALGVAAFVLFLPTAVGVAAATGANLPRSVALGILIGITLDIAVNGATTTYDLVWQAGWLPLAAVAGLVLGQFWLLYVSGRALAAGSCEPAFRFGLSWAALGPFLALQLLIFANLAAAAAGTGWDFAAALGWLLACHILAIGVVRFPRRAWRWLWITAWVFALGMQTAVLITGPHPGWFYALYLLAGQLALAGTMMIVADVLGRTADRPGLRNIGTASGIGMALLVAILFAYYAVYDLALPFPNSILPLSAMILVLLMGVLPALSLGAGVEHGQRQRLAVLPAMLLLLLAVPLMWSISKPALRTASAGSQSSLKVMTYNLHNGFHPDGQLALESLARNIEVEDPDVVGLQEISRGWVINGSADMATWLGRRLGMTVLFGPTADAQWGNAILTRLPVLGYEERRLPVDDLLLKRGFLAATLQLEDGGPITIIDTHLHNPQEGGDIRVLQSEALLAFWQEDSRTILMGDFNADRDAEEIQLLLDGGFVEVLDQVGAAPRYTNPVPGPYRQIDYVFVSPDWTTTTAAVPDVEGSDHLPVTATISANP